MFSVAYLSLSICYQCHSIIISDARKWRGPVKCHIEWDMWKKRRWWIYSNTLKGLILNLTECHNMAILATNRLLYSVKGMVGYHKRNWILGVRIVFLEPINPAANQCLCCHHRRSRKANIFLVLPMTSGGKMTLLNLNVRYYVKNNFFEKDLIKTKEIVILVES